MAFLLTAQELHNLAMNIVGKDLEEKGYEFLGVNSQLKRDPQFVALKDGNLNFVIVRAKSFPENAHTYDTTFMKTIKDHAIKFEAKTFYAGVGLGSAENYQQPLEKGQEYAVIYKGLQEI